jgi:hypothetical protein
MGHLYAINSEVYPADGFSQPYQVSIYIGGFLIAFIGLFFLKEILNVYYSDTVSAWTLLLIVLCSNYLEYAGITNAMTHNNLFTLYTLLIYNTIKFYEKYTWKNLCLIAIIIGLMALTRPTEIIAAIIPLLWGLKSINLSSVLEKLSFLKAQRTKIGIAFIIVCFIGSIQLIYWKYVTGDMLVYSYEDQGFSWLRPHIIDGLFSYKSGWLIYSPIFFFAILGFHCLFKNNHAVFWPSFIFLSIFIYVAFAWDIWWYGGSLGQRTMVQTYPIVALPLAAFIERVSLSKVYKFLFISICCLFSYFNIWLIYQAHGGGLLQVSQMTKGYFWEVVGRYELDRDKLKLLDNKDYYEGMPASSTVLYSNDFESLLDSCFSAPIAGNGSLCLPGGENFSPEFRVDFNDHSNQWIRATATFKASSKEWDVWKMPQFIIKFYSRDKEIKSRSIRVHRHLDNSIKKQIYLDAKIPKKSFDHIGIFFWNPGSPHSLMVDDLKIETF